jgi:hypothetical protein
MVAILTPEAAAAVSRLVGLVRGHIDFMPAA